METIINKNLIRLGLNIKKFREHKKLTQYMLAKEIIMDQSNLARIEKGESNPTAKTLIKISIVLDCDVRDFFEFNSAQ